MWDCKLQFIAPKFAESASGSTADLEWSIAQWLHWPEAVWKRSESLAAKGWVQKFCPLISGLPVGISNKKGKKARLGLHGRL